MIMYSFQLLLYILCSEMDFFSESVVSPECTSFLKGTYVCIQKKKLTMSYIHQIN